MASSSSSTGTTTAKPAIISLEQSRSIAKTHFNALRSWLNRENGLQSNQSRTSAREKLTRLTRQQFQELSTDVYDELVRRQQDSGTYLSVRNDFHPKRNQARQKLATLPTQRFKDLASDVYFELERRYPEFAEEDEGLSRLPSSSLGNNNNNNNNPSSSSSSSASTTPAQGLLSSRSRDPHISHVHSGSNSSSNNARLSNDTAPSSSTPAARRSPPPPSQYQNQGNAPTNEIVVPNKSTLVLEEEPKRSGGASSDENHHSNSNPNSRGASLARGTSESSFGGRLVGQYAGSTTNTERRSWDAEELQRVRSEYEYKITMLSKRTTEMERENEQLSISLQNKTSEASRTRDLEAQLRSHRDRYDEQTSTLESLQSEHKKLRSTHAEVLTSNGSATRLQDELDLVVKERNDIEDLANDLRGECSSLVDELRSVNERYEELLQASEMEIQERKQLEEEIRSWRKKFELAKTELRNVRATSSLFVGSAIKVDVDHMPATPDGIIADVNVSAFQLSIDALISAARSKEPSSVLPAMRTVVGVIDAIDYDIQTYVDSRRLASLPSADQDRLAALKSKTNATLSNLMTASKNHAMSFGVSPVSLLDAAASHLSATVVDLIRLLKIRKTSGTEGILQQQQQQQQQRNDGATSPTPTTGSSAYGLTPVRAEPTSHHRPNFSTSSSNTNASSSQQDRLRPQQPSMTSNSSSGRDRDYVSPPTSAANTERYDAERYNSNARTTDRRNQPDAASTSSSSSSSNLPQQQQQYRQQPQQQPARIREDSYEERTSYHDNPSSLARKGSVLTYGSPRLSQDRNGSTNGAVGGGGEEQKDNWDEVKNYLETQTEAIVHSIQSLLSAIRGGAQSEQLNENLTQIITIVSSIVAISKEALLPSTRQEGETILLELENNCDKLSEMQMLVSGSGNGNSGGAQAFNKSTKQAMASASFGVAKSLKSLNALLSSRGEMV